MGSRKKKKIEKNLITTFQILSKCHFLNFLSHWGGCLAPRPQVDTPINLHLTILNYQENKKKKLKKKIKKKIQKKSKSKKKKIEKNLSATFQIFSKCHFLNFLSHRGGCVWLPGHK